MATGKIGYFKMALGADPEFFFKKGGAIIGSEKVLPVEGIKIQYTSTKFTRDGVQAELNPTPYHCRQQLAGEIGRAFEALYATLKKMPGVKIDFSRTVKITRREMKSLLPESQQFGCTPSFNAYTDDNEIAIKDASKYYSRSAGGHIHLGGMGYSGSAELAVRKAYKEPRRLIKVLDIVVGNTCVLVDQDKGNAKRREIYGKAGEFRIPAHGIEYRTPSNFWLQSYTLMSMVFGLARQAVSLVASSTETNDFAAELLASVSEEDIQNAINKNDVKLAQQNFEKYAPILARMSDSSHSFNEHTLPKFRVFASKPMSHWFKTPHHKHWNGSVSGTMGFELFMANITLPTPAPKVEKAEAIKRVMRQVRTKLYV